MMLKRRLFILSVAIAVAAAGCAGPAENIAENIIENQLEEEGGSGNVELDIDEDGGSVSIETDEGSIQIGGAEIPDDFPLPLPDYEEVAGVITQTEGDTTYTQIILGFDPDDIDEVADLYEDFFNDQGWDVSRSDTNSDGTTFIFINGTTDEVDAAAIIGFGEDDDAASLTLSYSSGG